jgi:hypothetical protein
MQMMGSMGGNMCGNGMPNMMGNVMPGGMTNNYPMNNYPFMPGMMGGMGVGEIGMGGGMITGPTGVGSTGMGGGMITGPTGVGSTGMGGGMIGMGGYPMSPGYEAPQAVMYPGYLPGMCPMYGGGSYPGSDMRFQLLRGIGGALLGGLVGGLFGRAFGG